MNWVSAFFSYWLSPVYLITALLFGLMSYFSISSNKKYGIKILAHAKLKYARFVAAIIFAMFAVVALYASYGALVFQYYLTVKKIHP